MKHRKSRAMRRRNFLVRSYILLLALILVVSAVAFVSQTAFATTYVINDGERTVTYTTFATDPAQVLQEAGVALSADDTYTTAAGDGVSEIKVNRAQNITVYNGDEILQVTAYGETLQTLFDRLGIMIDETVAVSMPLDTVTYEGMLVRVNRKGVSTESYTVEVPFEITYIDDPTLPLGEEKILVAGKAGQMLCTANVVYVDGQESQRNVYQQTVTREPVTQVVAKGTGEQVGQPSDKPLIGDGVIVLPTGEVLTFMRKETFVATAYTHTDEGCDEYTANGTRVKWGVVAVDPKVIPYGTRMFIVANDGSYVYGLSTAEDCGGAIQNKRLDLYMPTTEECFQFGIRDCTVYFLGDANWRAN